MTSLPELKSQILRLTREYSRQVHGAFRPASDPQRQPWQEGTAIPYAGRVFTEDEVEAAVSSTLDFWLTLGSEGAAMEKELALSPGTFNLWFVTVRFITPIAVGVVFIYNLM